MAIRYSFCVNCWFSETGPPPDILDTDGGVDVDAFNPRFSC
jgi:hypothetical protein